MYTPVNGTYIPGLMVSKLCFFNLFNNNIMQLYGMACCFSKDSRSHVIIITLFQAFVESHISGFIGAYAHLL